MIGIGCRSVKVICLPPCGGSGLKYFAAPATGAGAHVSLSFNCMDCLVWEPATGAGAHVSLHAEGVD